MSLARLQRPAFPLPVTPEVEGWQKATCLVVHVRDHGERSPYVATALGCVCNHLMVS